MCLIDYCIIWIDCFWTCMCAAFILSWAHFCINNHPQSFSMVHVLLSCSLPGCQGPLELLLRILVPVWVFALHYTVPPLLLYSTVPYSAAAERSFCWLTMVHNVRMWALCATVKSWWGKKLPLLPHHQQKQLQKLFALCDLTPWPSHLVLTAVWSSSDHASNIMAVQDLERMWWMSSRQKYLLLCIHSPTGGNVTLSFFHTCLTSSPDLSGVNVWACFFLSVYKMPQVVWTGSKRNTLKRCVNQ